MAGGAYLKLCKAADDRGLRVELAAVRGRLSQVRVVAKGGSVVSRRVVRSLDYAARRLLEDLGA